jgi:hypothetical protein
MFNFLKKVNGTYSVMNVFNFLIFLIACVDVLKPLIPSQWEPWVLAGVGIVNIYIRMFQSSGQPIMGTELKDETLKAG